MPDSLFAKSRRKYVLEHNGSSHPCQECADKNQQIELLKETVSKHAIALKDANELAEVLASQGEILKREIEVCNLALTRTAEELGRTKANLYIEHIRAESHEATHDSHPE